MANIIRANLSGTWYVPHEVVIGEGAFVHLKSARKVNQSTVPNSWGGATDLAATGPESARMSAPVDVLIRADDIIEVLNITPAAALAWSKL